MKNIEQIKPSGIFTNYIYKSIPLAFDESMSYYETLCGVLNLLKDQEIIVNNNADALKELQDYVTHYFDNLDVQEEINNKLDKMAESGELTDIIAQYLQLAGVLAYDTKTAMKSAENLVNGSIAKTLGNLSYSDGEGAFYKVRQIQNTDVVDDNNIVALHNPDLVAEKILFSSGYEIQSYLQGQIDQITQTSVATEMVVFGDSWSDLSVTESVWPTYVAGELRLHLHDYAVNGAGFVSPANNLIETQITTAQSDTTYNKNYVKFVVLCGGINDYRNSVNFEVLRQKICDLYNSCKTIFPNAKILYVNNFQYPYTQTQSAFWYQLQYHLSSYGVSALNQDGFFKEQFFVDNLYHLTQNGQRLFGSNIMSALTGGQIKNDGVTIHFDLTNTYLYMKRIDNMVMYTLFVNNLSSTDTQTITASEDLCWVDNFDGKFMNCVGRGFVNAIAQLNNDNTILIAKSKADFTELYYSGNVPINIQL